MLKSIDQRKIAKSWSLDTDGHEAGSSGKAFGVAVRDREKRAPFGARNKVRTRLMILHISIDREIAM
jgi:hypothetical protein